MSKEVPVTPMMKRIQIVEYLLNFLMMEWEWWVFRAFLMRPVEFEWVNIL
jgi:hypothetical protein